VAYSRHMIVCDWSFH